MKPTLLAAAAAIALTAAAPAYAWPGQQTWNSVRDWFSNGWSHGFTGDNKSLEGRITIDDRDGDGQKDDDENNNGYGGVSWDGGD